MAKKEEAKKNEGKEVKKKEKGLKIGDTNITEYNARQLLDMWNTSTEESFKALYPEATFDRGQCNYQLKKEYGMIYTNGFMIPRGFDREQIIELINSYNGDVERTSDKHQMVYNDTGEPTKRITITVKKDTAERWQAMLKERCAKRDDKQGYYTLALEKLMDELEAGLKIVREM